jgi:hypothetical protein
VTTPFATADDLAARWRPLELTEQERADALLGDASAHVRAMCHGIDDRIEAGELDPAVVLSVVVAMVKRAMIAADTGIGVGAQQQTAGPYSTSLTFTNPTGSIYLTRADRRLLGCRGAGGHAFAIDTAPPDDQLPPDLDVCRPEWWF